MARILGIGGIFFKSHSPKELAHWYQKHLGLTASEEGGSILEFKHLTENGFAVWGPFEENTDYFQPSSKGFMFNFIVDDLNEALSQAKKGGAQVMDRIEEHVYGRFGWFIDPEGNKVELWQPSSRKPKNYT